MFDVKELYWAAGFIEGEGSFYLSSSKSTTATAFQNETEPGELMVHDLVES